MLCSRQCFLLCKPSSYSLNVPTILGKFLPINNITNFTIKQNSQDVGIQNQTISRFAKGEMPLGMQVHQLVNLLKMGMSQMDFYFTHLGGDLLLLYFLPLFQVHMYQSHRRVRVLNPSLDLLHGLLIYLLDMLLTCIEMSSNLFQLDFW